MITSTKFSSLVKKFSSESIRQDLIDMTLFCAVKFHADNNSDPIKRVEKSPMPYWIKNTITSFEYGTRNEHLTEDDLTPLVFKHVVLKLMDHNDSLAAAKELRKARKEELQTLRAASVAANPEIGEAGASVKTGNAAKDTGASKKGGAETKAGPVSKPEHSFWLVMGDEDHKISKGEALALLAHLTEMRKAQSDAPLAAKPRRTRKSAKVVNG